MERGDQFFAKGSYEEAALNYRKALQKNAQHGPAYLGVGKAEMRRRQFGEAYRSLSQAVQLLPENLEAKSLLADVVLGFYLTDARRPQHLKQQLTDLSEQFIQRNPDSFDGLRIRGYLALAENRFPEAIDFFRRSHAVKPADPELGLALAQSLLQNGQHKESEKIALDLVEQNRSYGPAYDLLYVQYLMTKKPELAEKILQMKVEYNPKSAEFLLQYARHLAGHGNRVQMKSVLPPPPQQPGGLPGRPSPRR
jgi:tetratricopeptide (TPR) repeat protein